MGVLKLDNARECERKLFGVLGVERFEVVRELVRNRKVVWFGTKLR